jgi:integrase
MGETPDYIIKKCQTDTKILEKMIVEVDDFIGDLKASGIAQGTISNYVKGVKALFKNNGLELKLPYKLRRRVKFRDRAPTPEELTKIIDIADIREKVIVSFLALGGFRVGTLVKLQYRHIQKDIEQGKAPIHIHVESNITKGKYADYDTFVGSEAVDYLKAYLEIRRKGTRKIPPETLTANSPLIRAEHAKTVRPLSESTIFAIVHNLYVKAGLITSKKRRYDLRPHSLRKYFRTQLGSLNTIPTDYIDYMMGHVLSTYNDVQMKGIEFLRNLYAQSGFSIRPKSKLSKIDQLKVIMEAWGLNPNEILSKEALSSPHRTIIDNRNTEIQVLNQSLKKAIIKELQSQNGIFV